MGKIRRTLTPQLLAANQANSQKSTGPRTESGKTNTSRNLRLSDVVPPGMKELGENSGEFYRLRDSLVKTFQPRDGFEQMLVEDMARIRWRLLRLQRAEAARLACQRRKFQLDRDLKAARAQTGPRAALKARFASKFGISGCASSHRECMEIARGLGTLRYSIEASGFQKDDRPFLEVIYGSEGGLGGKHLLYSFDKLCEASPEQSSEVREERRRAFLDDLDSEIKQYDRLASVYRESEMDAESQSHEDAQLLPAEEDLDKVVRYEAALERAFERKLQQFVAWRRARPADAAQDSSEATTQPAGMRHVYYHGGFKL